MPAGARAAVRGGARAAALLAPALLPLASEVPAAVACPAELLVLERPAGRELARVGLDAEGGFALSFRHSVTLRPVIDRYRIEEGAIVQVEALFDSHGPGLPDAAGPGLAFEPDGARFRVRMHRPIERLLLRPSRAFENRLEAASVFELWAFGPGPIELAPAPCASGR